MIGPFSKLRLIATVSLLSSVFLHDLAHAQMVDMSSSANTYLVPYGFETQLEIPSPWNSSSSSALSDMASTYSRAGQSFNGDRRQLIHWSAWGSPSYADGDGICRESNGNVVCLTPASASYLRW